MGFELRQQLKLAQQLVMTPQLQQAIKLLQLSMLELQQTVEQELQENPVLETAVAEESSESDTPSRDEQPSPAEKEVKAVDEDLEGGSSISEIDWNDYANEYEPSQASAPKENVFTVSGGSDQRTKKPNLQS